MFWHDPRGRFVKKLAVCLTLVLLAVVVLPGTAPAIVTGSAEWNWAEFQRDVDGGEQTDLSHFYQQYSLLYRDRQLINGGRAGRWTVGLGYEWTALAMNGGDEEDVETGKLLYEGELLFTPAGLPLTFSAYSHDLYRSYPSTLLESSANIIDPNVYIGIRNGQHVTSGATLVAGDRLGAIVGDYREYLAALPRLLVDYREDYVRDTKSDEPQHYRSRDLAFVSLNRKDNWFHYKIYDYTDFNDSTNDFQERVWLLGTVDHLNRRKWINLTNWLKLSVDGSLTRIDGAQQRLYGGGSDQYRLNLFSSAKRRNWNADNFTSMSRTTYKSGEMEKTFDFPFFAQGQMDPLHRWKLIFLGSSWEEDNMLLPGSDLGRKEDSLYTKFQLESKHYPGRILTPEGEVDWRRDNVGDGQAARFGIELRSDNPQKRTRDWQLAYSIARFESSQAESAYHEQVAIAAANYHPSGTVSYGGSQELAVGSGDYATNSTSHMAPTISRHLALENQLEERSLTGTSYRSTTNAYLELTPPGRWRNRFDFSYDLLHVESSLHQLQAIHRLVYAHNQLRFDTETVWAEGDNLGYPWQFNELSGLETVTGNPDMFFSHVARVNYMPNRYWDTSGQLQALWGTGERADGWLLGGEQQAAFHLFESSGIPRRWFSLEERFNYQRIMNSDSLWYAEMEIAASYYATRYLTFEGLCAVRHYGISQQEEFEFEAAVSTVFSKFEARLAYAYGQLSKETFLPGIKEQRWEIGLKKTF